VRLAGHGLIALASTFAVIGEARATQASGLRGTVMRCRDDASDEPAAGVDLRFTRNGRVAAEVTTTKTGRYFVRLAAGSYVVTSPHGRVGTALTPRIAGVHRGQIDAQDFQLETGIQ
jgi:hypothetical protein